MPTAPPPLGQARRVRRPAASPRPLCCDFHLQERDPHVHEQRPGGQRHIGQQLGKEIEGHAHPAGGTIRRVLQVIFKIYISSHTHIY